MERNDRRHSEILYFISCWGCRGAMI
jgi:hypothetical protein